MQGRGREKRTKKHCVSQFMADDLSKCPMLMNRIMMVLRGCPDNVSGNGTVREYTDLFLIRQVLKEAVPCPRPCIWREAILGHLTCRSLNIHGSKKIGPCNFQYWASSLESPQKGRYDAALRCRQALWPRTWVSTVVWQHESWSRLTKEFGFHKSNRMSYT